MQLTRINNNEQGFTLIEAMIALFLISVSLMAITRMQIGSLNGNRVALDSMQASFITSSVSNQLLCSSYETDQILKPTDQTGATLYPFTLQGLDPRYTAQYSVENVSLYSGGTYKILRVMTTWTTNGRQHSLSDTFIKLPNF